MGDFIFEVPWWAIAVLLADGLAFFIVGNRRLNARLRALGAGLIALALVWMAVSWAVQTDLEVADRQTRDLVRRVVAQDEEGIRALLHRRATAGNWNAEQIVKAAVHYARLLSLTSARVTGLQRERQRDDISVRLTVLSDHGSYPTVSTWRLDWQRVDQDWRLRRIAPLQIGNAAQGEVEERYLDRALQ
jgi:hypothetical protein